MADSQTICKSAGKCLAIVLFYYRKQGGKKMTLQQILEEVKSENPVKDDNLLSFFSKLLYSDEYDTSRELSYQIVRTSCIRSP